MNKTSAYVTIVRYETTGTELAFGSIKTAVAYLNRMFPRFKLKAEDVWQTKLDEGNVYRYDFISIRKVKKMQ